VSPLTEARKGKKGWGCYSPLIEGCPKDGVFIPPHLNPLPAGERKIKFPLPSGERDRVRG